MTPEMIPVSSSNVQSIGFDEHSQTLYVDFINGSRYQYFKVPKSIFEQFLVANSKGKFLHRNIKDKFTYSKLY